MLKLSNYFQRIVSKILKWESKQAKGWGMMSFGWAILYMWRGSWEFVDETFQWFLFTIQIRWKSSCDYGWACVWVVSTRTKKDYQPLNNSKRWISLFRKIDFEHLYFL